MILSAQKTLANTQQVLYAETREKCSKFNNKLLIQHPFYLGHFVII